MYKLVLSLAALAAAVPSSAQVPAGEFTQNEVGLYESDPKRFTLDPESIRFERVAYDPADGVPDIDPAPADVGSDLVVIDKIINTGLKVWSLIEKNKPVVDIATASASGLPQGVSGWSSLEGWNVETPVTYGFYAKNLYGTEVINVRYQVFRLWGGSYEGRGRYLAQVKVVPLRVDVAWGYRFSLGVEIDGPVNTGTKDDPNAGMMVLLNWKVATVVKESNGTSNYWMQGDGRFERVGSPFVN